MLRINSRFYIGLVSVDLLALLSLFTGSWIIVAAVFVVTNALYLSLFFMTLRSLNKVKRAYDEKVNSDPNATLLTEKEADQFKKMGSIEKNGKMYVNKEFDLWRQAEKRMKASEQLQSQMGKS